jgi:hypothetical protein
MRGGSTRDAIEVEEEPSEAAEALGGGGFAKLTLRIKGEPGPEVWVNPALVRFVRNVP